MGGHTVKTIQGGVISGQLSGDVARLAVFSVHPSPPVSSYLGLLPGCMSQNSQGSSLFVLRLLNPRVGLTHSLF